MLQLPLHYGSKTATEDTLHSLDENEWNARVEQVDKLSKDMNRAEKKVKHYSKDQNIIRRDVNDLKRRLERLKEKRQIREEWVQVHGVGNGLNVDGKKDE